MDSLPPESVLGTVQAGKHGVPAQAHSARQLGDTGHKGSMRCVIAGHKIAAEDTGTWDGRHMDTPHSPPHASLDGKPVKSTAAVAVLRTGTPVYMWPPEPLRTPATLRTLEKRSCMPCQAAEVPEGEVGPFHQARVVDPSLEVAVAAQPDS